MKCKIALGSHHAAYLLKEVITTWLEINQYVVIDFGTNSEDSDIDRILQSLPPSYKSFVMNYNMQG